MSAGDHMNARGSLRACETPTPTEYVVRGDTIVRLEPLGGTPYEPDVDEWLALPVGPPCPTCGGSYFGSDNCTGFLLTRHCHGDEDRPSCGTLFRAGSEELGMIVASIVGRFFGYRRRFWVGRYPLHASLLEGPNKIVRFEEPTA